MTYQSQLEETSTATSAQVLAALAAWQAGRMSTEAFRAVVVAYLQAGNTAAATVADLSLAATLTVETGSPVAPLGIGPAEHAVDADRLAKATETMLTLHHAERATTDRWDRLTRAEGRETAARAYSEGIRRSSKVSGWRRGITADACQLCRWWSREGRVWPADHTMPTHKGCTCNPVPVLADRINPVRYH